jgi:hypothetical protein
MAAIACLDCADNLHKRELIEATVRIFALKQQPLEKILAPFQGVQFDCIIKRYPNDPEPKETLYRLAPDEGIGAYDTDSALEPDGEFAVSLRKFDRADSITVQDASSLKVDDAKRAKNYPRIFLAKFNEDKAIQYATAAMGDTEFAAMVDSYAAVARLMYDFHDLVSPETNFKEVDHIQPLARTLLNFHARAIGNEVEVVHWDSTVTLTARLFVSKTNSIAVRGKPDGLVCSISTVGADPAPSTTAANAELVAGKNSSRAAYTNRKDKGSKIATMLFKTVVAAEDAADACRRNGHLLEIKPTLFQLQHPADPDVAVPPLQSAVSAKHTVHQVLAYLVGSQQASAPDVRMLKALVNDILASRLMILLNTPGRAACWVSPVSTTTAGTCALNYLYLRETPERIAELMRDWSAENEHPMPAAHYPPTAAAEPAGAAPAAQPAPLAEGSALAEGIANLSMG